MISHVLAVCHIELFNETTVENICYFLTLLSRKKSDKVLKLTDIFFPKGFPICLAPIFF